MIIFDPKMIYFDEKLGFPVVLMIGNNDNKHMQIMQSDQTDALQSDCARIFELVFVCVFVCVCLYLILMYQSVFISQLISLLYNYMTNYNKTITERMQT